MGLPEINIVERTNKTIYIPKSRFTFGNMMSDENTKSLDKMTEQVDDNIHKGMDNFPIEVFNQMIEYNLTRGAIRNAMLMVCMANWGMRFSDLTRVRFGYLFDNEGRFKDSFSLINGEQKTKKTVVYYNNAATEEIISLYLQQPVNKKKTRLDYLFVSESATGNKPVATVRELEANDLFDTQIEQIKKAIKNNEKNKSSLLNKYIENKLTDEEYNLAKRMIEEEHNELTSELNRVTNDKENYISPTPKADRIYIQKPITHTAGEDIIKDTLKKIGINAKNRKNKDDEQTTKSKYNTHSLRKTFADEFIKTGERLDSNSDLHFSNTILELLKDKFKHSSKSVTTHYTNAQEEAFKIICQNLNIGLESIRNFV